MRKGVVLVVVIGIVMAISVLALAALYLMTQESRIAEHRIKRTKAFFAAQAGMIYVLEGLRLMPAGTDPIGVYCINGTVGVDCPGTAVIHTDSTIPYVVVLTVSDGAPTFPDTYKLEIKVDY